MDEQFFQPCPQNISLTDTHRITYLQNSVVGKAKEKVQAYSCHPAHYPIALKELMNHFGDPSIVLDAVINQLEAWHPNSDYNKQNTNPNSEWFEQLQILPISFVNGIKVFDTYSVINHGS